MSDKLFFKCVDLEKVAQNKQHYNIDKRFGYNRACRLLAYDDHSLLPNVKRVVDSIYTENYPMRLVDEKRPLTIVEKKHIATLEKR